MTTIDDAKESRRMSGEEAERKLRALLRLSQSPVEGEAMAAAAKAVEIAAAYKIDLFKLEQAAGAIREDAVEETIYEGTFVVEWRRVLLHYVARAYDLGYFILHDQKSAEVMERLGPRYKSRKWTRLQVVGTPTNIKLARQTFEYLDETVQRLGYYALQEYKRDYAAAKDEFLRGDEAYLERHGEDDFVCADEETGKLLMYKFEPNSFADGWRKGCVRRVGGRLLERKTEMEKSGVDVPEDADYVMDRTGTAMVLAAQSRQLALQVEEYVKRHHPDLKDRPSNDRVHGTGYTRGREAGESIGLDPQIEGGSRRPAGALAGGGVS